MIVFAVRVFLAALMVACAATALVTARHVTLQSRKVSLWMQLVPLGFAAAFWTYNAVWFGTSAVPPPFTFSAWLSRLPYLGMAAAFWWQQRLIIEAERADREQRRSNDRVHAWRRGLGERDVLAAVESQPGQVAGGDWLASARPMGTSARSSSAAGATPPRTSTSSRPIDSRARSSIHDSAGSRCPSGTRSGGPRSRTSGQRPGRVTTSTSALT